MTPAEDLTHDQWKAWIRTTSAFNNGEPNQVYFATSQDFNRMQKGMKQNDPIATAYWVRFTAELMK